METQELCKCKCGCGNRNCPHAWCRHCVYPKCTEPYIHILRVGIYGKHPKYGLREYGATIVTCDNHILDCIDSELDGYDVTECECDTLTTQVVDNKLFILKTQAVDGKLVILKEQVVDRKLIINCLDDENEREIILNIKTIDDQLYVNGKLFVERK